MRIGDLVPRIATSDFRAFVQVPESRRSEARSVERSFVNSGLSLFRKQDRVQLYLEYSDTLIAGESDARQADIGVRWRPWENIQFDAGCNFGVSADAPDYQPFVGFVTRFRAGRGDECRPLPAKKTVSTGYDAKAVRNLNVQLRAGL